jgi:hypothetical protein
MPYPEEVNKKLIGIYEDMIWLASRPHNTEARARAWYSQVWSGALKRQVRLFSGRVSRAAAADVNGSLCLEHYERLAARITELLNQQFVNSIVDHREFLALIEECEQVNITTDQENHAIQAARGDYGVAGIDLIDWLHLTIETRQILFNRKIRGQVANANEYIPRINTNVC